MIIVTATCANNHVQQTILGDEIGMEWAEDFVGLLDGTSKHYKFSPIGTDSPIGKCGICGAQLKCDVKQN